jgi:hypothetical protein
LSLLVLRCSVICDGEFKVLDVIPPFFVVVVVVCKWKGRLCRCGRARMVARNVGGLVGLLIWCPSLRFYAKLMNKSMVGMCEVWRKLIRWLNRMSASIGLCGIEVVN